MRGIQLLEYLESWGFAKCAILKHGFYEGHDFGERIDCKAEGEHYYERKRTHAIIYTFPGEPMKLEVYCMRHWLDISLRELDTEMPEGSFP